MDTKAAIVYIIQIAVESMGIRYDAGAYDPDENKFIINVSSTVSNDLKNALENLARVLMGDATVTIEFNVV